MFLPVRTLRDVATSPCHLNTLPGRHDGITGSHFHGAARAVWDLMMDPKAIAPASRMRGARSRTASIATARITLGARRHHRHLRRHRRHLRESGKVVVPAGGRRTGPGGIRERQRRDYASPSRRRYGGRSHRYGADRRRDRAPRSAPDWLRRKDDAGPLLRLHARQSVGGLGARQRLLERAPGKHRNHRATIVCARVQVGIQVGDCAPGLHRRGVDHVGIRLLPGQRFLDLGQPHGVRRGAGQANARGLDDAARGSSTAATPTTA